jgi:hypothetical protein
MGLFDDHIGVWCGTHLVIDSQGREIERFEATVRSRREGDRWFQTTTRAWPDGRATESEFTGTFDAAGVLHYQSPRVVGRGIDVGDGNIISIFKDPDEPDVTYCSIITLLSRDRRVRTVQKIENGRLASRTLVKEARVH